MADLSQPGGAGGFVSAFGAIRKQRLFFIALLACLTLFAAANASCQDLGALARQEQARRQAQPSTPRHVYTNDDLDRPHILTPEDQAAAAAAKLSATPAIAATPAEPIPSAKSAPLAESAPLPDPPEESLGEIAKRYREQKLASQKSQPEVATLVPPAHTYTNDDLVRPQILTPQDRVVFEAARRDRAPLVAEKSEGSLTAPADIPSPAPREQGGRVIARNLSPQEQEPRSPGNYPLLLGGVSLAEPIRRITTSSPARRRRSAPRPGPGSRRVAIRYLRPPPEAGSRLITIRRGDSLWKLAREYLGRGSGWKTLLKTNPWIRNPNVLQIGTQIRI